MRRVCSELFAERTNALFLTPQEQVLVLWSYFDESGHPDDPEIHALAMGGCLASCEQWLAFSADWQEALSTENVQWFHMKDFAHHKGEFTKKKGWTEARRRKLLGQLVKIMLSYGLKYTGWAKPLQSLKIRPTLEDSYNEAYRICILYAEHQAAGEGVNFVFSEHAEISGEVYRLRHEAVRRAHRHRRLGSMTFANPRYIPPLQAADLIAYELRKHAEDMKKSLRWPLQQLPRERCRFELW